MKKIKNFSLEYDRDYGINKRKGWSVSINGSYYATFWFFPFTAIIGLWKFYRCKETIGW